MKNKSTQFIVVQFIVVQFSIGLLMEFKKINGIS